VFDLAKKLFELTQQMKHSSEQSEWEAVEQIQQQRLTVLKLLHESPIEQLPEQAAREVTQLLQETQRLEDVCEQLAVNQRNQLTKEHGKVSKGKAMQQAYGAHRNKF